MELHVKPSIRVKHYVLVTISHMLSHVRSESVVSCEPIYHGRMDATGLSTTVRIDDKPCKVLVAFRVQRRTTNEFELGVHFQMASDALGDGPMTEVNYEFDPKDETSVREAVIQMATTTVFFLTHGHMPRTLPLDARHVFAPTYSEQSMHWLFDSLTMPSFALKALTY
ncbi:hypothetical protein D3C71_77750 [compost metagenome]